ncbi:hypothetical protein Q1W73_10530 [Asticcacaulis sp. ZE23SCel15]|uniref:hypothetical protein n=1 Tax=Asticcacaulis sp. ZE23SCel15 TaxID=3059027 RepID=UPI00265E0370|nr:hypothetical protein [Asticcacaulis sp. ZE23SCel15]WKL56135.1 hypothetical protein Q1W73_10530 [Asticcacaulis sp. ZE23SCel15]
MNTEAFARLWRTHNNDLSQTAQAYLLEDMMTTLKQRRDRQNLFFLLMTAILGTITFVAGYDMIKNDSLDPAREWAVLLMLAAPWAALLLMRRRFNRHLNAFPNTEGTLPDTLRVMADENRAARTQALILLVMMVIFPVITGFALWQLMLVGKMELAHVQQAALLFGGALGASALWQVIRYVRVLKPEGARLKALLQDYQS